MQIAIMKGAAACLLAIISALSVLAGEVASYPTVTITVDHAAQAIAVEPEVSRLRVKPSEEQLPTQVRWVVQCVETNDGDARPIPCPEDRKVMIRFKNPCNGRVSETAAEGEEVDSHLVDPTRYEGVVCDEEVDFDVPDRKDAPWNYDVLVTSGWTESQVLITDELGGVLLLFDPSLWIEKEGGD